STAPHKPSVIKLTSAVHAPLLACRLPGRRRVMFLRRRRLIAASGLAAASAALPRLALGQLDRRPSLTIAVQQISNSASLEPTREVSKVGGRPLSFISEALIMPTRRGQLEPVPGLAESWKRLDERTIELALRKGVKFHNGDEMTADDVVFTFGR